KSLLKTRDLSSPQIAHKVQQLFLHLIKRLPTIAAIVYSQLLQFCGDERHKWPSASYRTKEVARRLPLRLARRLQ
ncbi:hypothetical protein ACXWZO_004728, partial [Enterobacter hormaechei]